jgi:coenzyme F420 hydrogenase subunit beta
MRCIVGERLGDDLRKRDATARNRGSVVSAMRRSGRRLIHGRSMPFADLKREILDPEMCARCGACAAVCPPGWLAIGDDGAPLPAIDVGSIDCGDCNLCLDVCPGRDPDTPRSETRIFGRTRTPAERWTGIFEQSLLVASVEPRVLSRAAAGGAGSSLLLAALRSRLVDAVVVVGRDRERPWAPAALITDDEEELLNCAQTSYCITPNLQTLRDPRFARVAVVGVPCEVQAIAKMKNLAPVPTVAEKVVLTLEIACASNTKREGTEHLITEKLGVALGDVREMRYRDGEYPGEFAVTTRDGKRHALPFFELVDEFKRFKTHRCLACGDWWSGLADVSISDGDPNIYASSQTGARPPRQSMTMARTAAGREILRVAEELGLIESRPAAFQPETNLGLKATPQRAPTAPVAYDEPDALLSDAEVISRMANHRPVADEDRRAAPAETAIRISLDESRRDDVVFRPRGDKSISQRAMFAAALAQGTSSVRNVPASDDLQCNLAVLRQLGVDVWEAADSSYVVAGRGLRGLAAPAGGAALDVGNSATTARILIGLLAGGAGEFRVDGNALLRRRPMDWVVDPLVRAGADIAYAGERGRLPLRIRGAQLTAISHDVGVFSAQPVSALLFAGLQGAAPSAINRRVRARDHTERLLRHLGVAIEDAERRVRLTPPERLPAFDLTVPGDISSAALPIACVVASPIPRRLTIEGVGVNPTRTGFLSALIEMGAAIEIATTGSEGGEPVGVVTVESGRELRGVEVAGDAFVQSLIDELPLLAAVAARARGRTVIRDAGELKDKDTDRIATTAAVLRAFGVRIDARADGWSIEESRLASPGSLRLPPDHRVIFAAMTLASLLPAPTTLWGWERVSVSFPDCLELLGRLASVERCEPA